MINPKRLEFVKSAECDMGCDCGLIPDPVECEDGRFVFHSDYRDLLVETVRLKLYVDQLEGHIALIRSLGNDMAKKMTPCVALHNWVSATGGTEE